MTVQKQSHKNRFESDEILKIKLSSFEEWSFFEKIKLNIINK